jgi:hypothetical protein
MNAVTTNAGQTGPEPARSRWTDHEAYFARNQRIRTRLVVVAHATRPILLESRVSDKEFAVELPRRPRGDRYTTPGQYRRLESQIRRRVRKQDIPTLFVYAFDFRTRVGPFVYVDKTLIPGAPSAVAAALYAAGLTNVRVVMQQWTPNIRPSLARFDGNPPELLLVSSMQIHSAGAYRLIRDAWRLGDQRPLILAGGPKAIYEPWDFFGLSPDGREAADVVVTGEEYVLLELLDRILEHKGDRETMREAFERVRAAGLLEDIPGLVYRPDAPDAGPPEFLINTGVQRLVEDLDELPVPFDALGLFEPPHRRGTLSRHPVPVDRLRKHGKIMAIVTTHGCKFRCPYCPIPAYNQLTYRFRSAERLVEEMAGIAERSGIRSFFGTDDNFFVDRQLVEGIFSTMASGQVHKRPFRKAIWFATEATEFDVFKHQDLLPLARDAGLRGLWFGIEDLTARLVRKGQSAAKTKSLFKLLLRQGIAPMPMMMHHDDQPLWSWRGLVGLVNQVGFLRRAGALTCQITLLGPSVGSKSYDDSFTDGLVLCRVGGKPVEEYQLDGNHIVATRHQRPWRRQLNMLASYASFYNPVNLLRAIPKIDKLWAPRMVMQVYGMLGLAKSIFRARDWFRRLVSGPIEKCSELPVPKFRMVGPGQVDPALVYTGQGGP